MSKWATFNVPQLPPGFSDALTGISGGLDAAATASDIVAAALDALASAVPPSLDAAALLEAQALRTLREALEGLVAATGVYVLLVPPHAHVPIPPEMAGLFQGAPIPQGSVDVLNTLAESPTAANFLQATRTTRGGTAGFVRAVLESLEDPGDIHRPLLPDSTAISGVYLVAGAADLPALLPTTASLSTLVGQPDFPKAILPGSPAGQDLRARASATGVRLDWKLPGHGGFINLPAQDSRAYIEGIAVLRSPKPAFVASTGVAGIFGTTRLTTGMKTPDGTEVLGIIENPTGAVTAVTWNDDGPLDPSTPYFYAVSLRVRMRPKDNPAAPPSQWIDVGYQLISGVAKVVTPKQLGAVRRTAMATPPDWFRTPRAIDVIPFLGMGLDMALAELTGLSAAANASGYGDFLKAAAQDLRAQIAQYRDRGAATQQMAAQLQSLASLSLGGVSARSFSGSGGMPFLRSDIIKAFSDNSDPNKPYFPPTHFVTGAVILATTPDAKALVDTLFGAAQGVANPFIQAAAQLDRLLGTLAPAMDGRFAPPAAPAAPKIGADDDGEYCFQSYEGDA